MKKLAAIILFVFYSYTVFSQSFSDKIDIEIIKQKDFKDYSSLTILLRNKSNDTLTSSLIYFYPKKSHIDHWPETLSDYAHYTIGKPTVSFDAPYPEGVFLPHCEHKARINYVVANDDIFVHRFFNKKTKEGIKIIFHLPKNKDVPKSKRSKEIKYDIVPIKDFYE